MGKDIIDEKYLNIPNYGKGVFITQYGIECPYCKAITNHVGPHVYCPKCFARGNYLKNGGYIWKRGTK